MYILSKLYKYISLYINNSINFVKPKVKLVLNFVKKHKNEFIIGLTALPVAIIWGLLFYKWFTTPRPAKLGVAAKDNSYYFQGSSILYSVKIGDKKTNEPKVEFSIDKNKSVTFSPASASSGIPVPTEKNNIVTFKNVYPNTDYTYKTIPLGIKEDIIVHKANTISVYPFYIETNGVTPKYYTTNIAGGVFYDEKGNYLFNFEKPYAIDAKKNRTDKVGITIKKDSVTGKLVALLTVDADWLKDTARVYPVTIDPTVVRNTTAGFAAGQLNRVVDTGSGSSPNLTTNYQELPADINTVGLWHMNEASGTTTVSDSSGNGNTGTSSSSTNVATGQLSNARSFNGTSDYIEMANSASLQVSSSFSFEMWIKRNTDSGTYERLLSKSDTSGYDYFVQIYTNDTLECGFTKADATTYYGFGSTIPVGVWTHVACTFDLTNGLNVYVNGVSSNGAATGTIAAARTSTRPFEIGRLGSTSWYYSFNGLIDEVLISNIARAQEEIKLDAQRQPYSVYTSEVIDLSKAQTWNSLSWTELGVNTGDGETLKDATSLVAQWNLNATTSTATATNDAGSCGSSCDGTLTGFTNTTGQDVLAGSGWTANNRRWGTGALMFDGVNDYITIPDSSNFTFTDFSVEFWIRPNKNGTYDSPIGQYDNGSGATGDWWNFERPAGTTISFKVDDDTAVTSADSTTTLVPGNWYHVVGVRDQDSTLKIYINGKEEGSVAETPFTIDSSQSVYIGNQYANSRYFSGVLDSTRIYSRALTASEILSNYQAGNIELQTRVGSSTNADDGTWEAWKPVTGETAIASMDTDAANWTWDSSATYMPQLKSNESNIKMEGSGSLKQIIGQPQADGNTVGLWHLDETGGTGAYLKDSTANANNGTPTGPPAVVNGFSGKARSFNGSSDYIEMPDSVSLRIGVPYFTFEAWISPGTVTGCGADGAAVCIIANKENSYEWGISNTGKLHWAIANTTPGWAWVNTGVIIPSNTWSHIVLTYDGINVYTYLNGVLSNTSAATGNVNNTTYQNALRIGARGAPGVASSFFPGKLDEIRIGNSVRTADEVAEAYRAGRDHYLNRTISANLGTSTTLPFYVASDRQGTFLNAVIGESAFANYQPDANTMGLWHLDENNQNVSLPITSGLSFWVKADAITGLADGAAVSTWSDLSGNARNLTAPGNSPIYKTGIVNGMPIVRFTAASTQRLTNAINFTTPVTVIYVARQTGGANARVLSSVTNNWLLGYWGGGKNQAYFDGWVTPSGTPVTDTSWHVFSGVETGALSSVYADGGLVASNAGGVTGPNGLELGCNGGGTECSDADIAEVIIYNSALSATDRASVETYLNAKYNINGGAGMPSYLKDSSGNSNNGAPAGTTSTQGKIGKARYFNGTSDFVSIPDSNSLDITTDLTLEAWINPSVSGNSAYRTIVSKRGNSTPTNYQIYLNNAAGANQGELRFYNGTEYSCAYIPQVNQWTHVAITISGGTNLICYANGVAVKNLTISGLAANTNSLSIGRPGEYPGGEYFAGTIDEVRIDNIVRTADDIRQAYEVGARTHPITIDFKAKLGAGNLITGVSDLGFTVDETTYGSYLAASHLFLGDKIIVKENYDGTEYIAQGTVNSINTSTGSVSVSAWDTGSTVPSVGFSVNATVFKWQREYFDVRGSRCTATTDTDCDRFAVTNLTLRVTDGSQGATVYLDDFRSNDGYLTTPAGSTIMSSTGDRYFQYRAIPVSYDTAVSASLTSVTLDYTPNVAPNTPSFDLPADTATGQSLTPILKTTTTDTDLDNIQYKIQICTDLAMTLNCQTFDQTSSQTGWSGQNADGGTTYISSTQGIYTVQTALNAGATYYWRSYAIDPAGVNTWSSTQATPYSFTTTQPPSAPTLLLTQGLTNPTGVATLTPYFSAIHNDSEGDGANYYQIQVNTASDFSGTSMWNSGKTGMTLTANAARSPDITYAGSAPSWAATYYWRIKFWDTFGVGGAYSSAAQFTMDVVSNAPTLDLPTNGVIDQGLLTVFKTTATDPDSDYLRYKIQICTDLAMTLDCQTFDQTSSQTGWSGQDYPPGGPYTAYASATQAVYTIQSALSPSTTYFWRSYAIDPTGTNTWGSTQTPYSFTTTNAPLAATSCRISETPDDTSLTVVWTDNATNEDNYEVQRSLDGADFLVLHTNLPANTESDLDSTVTSGHTYRYRVAPYFTAGPTYGSWCTTDTLSLGVGTFLFKGVNLKGLILQ